MPGDDSMLLCRVGHLICSLPLSKTEETMRPLPVDAVAGAPAYVRGIALIRGVPVPVVDTTALLHGRPGAGGTRFVTVRTGDRQVALSVDSVIGVARIGAAQMTRLPPLLRDVPHDLVSALGVLDAELMVVLQSARLVPDAIWAALETAERRA